MILPKDILLGGDIFVYGALLYIPVFDYLAYRYEENGLSFFISSCRRSYKVSSMLERRYQIS